MTLEQAVIFAILMENGEGIIGKSPSYIKEKLESCEMSSDEFLEGMLDSGNRFKLYGWKKTWRTAK